MLLQISDLQVVFSTETGPVCAVDGISFQLDSGQTLGLVGESGCGKSVTAQTILRLLPEPPAKMLSGKVLFEGRDLLKMPDAELRRVRGKEIGFIFQEPMTALNPVYTVGFQIAEVLMAHEAELPRATIKKRVLEMLDLVGIPSPNERYDTYPHELSGGMRQRVMIAMALICRPKLLIADEPTTALDVTIQAQIMELIQRLQKDLGMAMLLITHDLGVVTESVDDVIVMYAGKIAEQASVKELFHDPLHPYTRGLLASIPKLGRKERLQGIPGTVPDITKLPSGCRFHDRCGLVQPRCRESVPPLEEKSGAIGEAALRCEVWIH